MTGHQVTEHPLPTLVAVDVYPVTLRLPDGSKYSPCKARIDGAGVAVYRWDPEAQAPALLFQSAEVVQDGPKRWHSGDATLIKGCPCGSAGRSPLRNATLPGGNVAVTG